MNRFLSIFILLFTFQSVKSQNNSKLIDSLLQTNNKAFSNIILNHKKYRIQIIYTEINRDKNNIPSFKQHNYFLDSSNYFYCASLVKLPCSIIALEKINEYQKKYPITKETTMFTDSVNACQRTCKKDTSAKFNLPSIAQYIKRMLLISDNFAYDKVYEFLGTDYLHNRLENLGFHNTRIVHRFDGRCKGTANTITNPVSFYDANNKLIFTQNYAQSNKSYPHPLGIVYVGKAYLTNAGKKVNEPKDFTGLNYLNLQTVNDVLKRLVFNKYNSPNLKYSITNDDHKFLLKYLSMYPRESQKPSYNTKEFYDSYKKYFIYGDSKASITNNNLKIFNIVGQSYGFMVDCAYIVDFKNNVEFMLSAVIYTNETEVINSGKYEYKSIALPYLAELGRTFYKYELARKKAVKPNLDEFKISN